jgi:hypothetical protein
MTLKHISLINPYEKLVAIGFSTPQLFLLGISGWLLAYSVVQDISQLIFSPLALNGVKLLLFVLPFTLIQILMPVYLLVLVMKNFRLPKREQFCKWKSIIKIVLKGTLILAVLTYAVVCIAAFIWLDMYFPFTVICPFMGILSLFSIAIFKDEFRHTKKNRLYSMIAFLVLVLLSFEQIDLSSSKTFIRDLYKVKRGMSGDEVEALLVKYQQGRERNQLDFLHLNPAFTGEASFRFTDGNDFGWGKINFNNGRVTRVEFIPAD